MHRPLIIAHRGQMAIAPENTLPSLLAAAEAGADIAELDIRLSLDRVPIVIHDALLGRTTRGRGPVRLWPSILLRRMAVRDGTVDDRIATLRDALRDRPGNLQLGLHLKDRGALAAVLRVIRRHGDPASTWLWLERHVDVYRATRALPEVRCTLLRPAGWTPSARHRYFTDAQRSGASAVSVPWGAIDRDVIVHARQHQLLIFSREEDVRRIRTHAEAGLDGIITDDVPATVAALSSRS